MIEETGGCTYSAPRDADGNLLPTRWRSDRCIDWLMISEPDVPIDIWADDAFVGDHRLVWAKIQVPCGFHHAREYKPTAVFRRPLDVEEKTWRQALASEFEDFQTTTWATPSLSGPTSTANFRSGSCGFTTPLVDRPRVYSAAVTKAAKWRGFLRARRPKLGASAALFCYASCPSGWEGQGGSTPTPPGPCQRPA